MRSDFVVLIRNYWIKPVKPSGLGSGPMVLPKPGFDDGIPMK
jgi:hypothetical protein